MTALPRALAPWAKALALFPDEVALLLGGIAARLAAVLGDGERWRAELGTLDGISGLARRGTYDRLLLSEWLLHDELPDEFMRRVVAGEHAFVERAYIGKAAHRRSLVLFDAGVAQLGGPRVVQLAALLVFAQRAARSNADFVWGVLQDEQCILHEAVTAGNIPQWLRYRCLRSVSSADVSRWRDKLFQEPSAEVWLVGEPRLASEALNLQASFLSVAERLEPDAPLGVVVRACPACPSLKPKSVTLELSPSHVTVQALRDPFGAAVAPRVVVRTAIDPTSNVVFSANGRLLYVRGKNGALLTFHLPNSPHDKKGAPRVFTPPSGQRVVAVGWSQADKNTHLVSERDGALFLHKLSKRGATSSWSENVELPPGYACRFAAELRPLGLIATHHAYFIDGVGQLVSISGGKLTVQDDADAVASKALVNGFAYVRTKPGPPRIVLTGDVCNLSESALDLSEPSTAFRLFFGAAIRGDLVAYAHNSIAWSIVRGDETQRWAVPPELSVAGVVDAWTEPRRPSLLVMDQARTQVRLFRLPTVASEDMCLFSTSSPIACLAASEAAGHVAAITENGELSVYSLVCNRTVLTTGSEDAW